MTPFILTLTQAGLAAIVNVQAGTIGPVTISEIGLSDTNFDVASTIDALPGEFKRLPVAGDQLGDDIINVTALDDSAEVYAYRAFALYSSTGVLFALYAQADPIVSKVAGSDGYLVLDVAMTRGQAEAISFGATSFANPQATTQKQGLVELATQEEASAGADTLRALTPATGKAALLAWLVALGGAGSNVDADRLDGHEGAWYADIVSRLGYVPFDSAGFTSAAIRAVLGYTPLDTAAFTRAAVEALMEDPARFGSNANGYWEQRPNGVLEQWGTGTAIDPWSADLTFPKPFADTGSVNLQVTSMQSDDSAVDGNKVNGRVTSASTYQLGADDLDKLVFWRAIGKAPA